VGSVELVSGRFDLLLACTRLFEALVEDFVSNAIQRRSSGVKSSARFGNDDEPMGTGVPDQSR
jgi:nuclear pore complex protein Nup188